MSTYHHGASNDPIDPEQKAAMDRLLAELTGKAERLYPQGRISSDDLGESAFAVATDKDNGIIRIQFTKPMTWLGLDRKTATRLRDLLSDGIKALE